MHQILYLSCHIVQTIYLKTTVTEFVYNQVNEKDKILYEFRILYTRKTSKQEANSQREHNDNVPYAYEAIYYFHQ